MSELPKGWVYVQIPDLIVSDGVFIDGDWVESKDQDPNGDVRLIQLADIGDGLYVNKSNRFLTHKRALELRCTFLQKGDVLVARMPDPLGRACIFPGDKKRTVTVVDICIVRGNPSHFSNIWLMYFINAPAFREDIHALQSGSTRKRISRGNLSTLKLPVPPVAEQTRIVEKLEELLSDLDAGVAELKAAQKKLKKYRQSLLKAAVEGVLTAEWRKVRKPVRPELVEGRSTFTSSSDHPSIPRQAQDSGRADNEETGAQLLQRILTERRARWEAKQLAKFKEQGKAPPKDWQSKYPEPVKPDTSDLPELPDGWIWASVDQCSLNESAITDGPFGSNLKSSHYQEHGPRVIRLQNIGDSIFVDAKAYISESHYLDLMKHAVQEDDLVIAMLGEVLPRACIVPNGVVPAIVKADCARVRVNPDLIKPVVLVAQLNSKPIRDVVVNFVKGIGRPRVNLSHIRSIPVALCSMDEQLQVEALLSEAQLTIDQLNEAIEQSLKQSAAQRKNILKAAFSGQLVPQDPNDEPASVLLERIRAERAVRDSITKPRKRKVQNA